MFDTTFTQASRSDISTTIPNHIIIQMLHNFDLMMKLNSDYRGHQLVKQHSDTTWEYRVEDSLAFIPKKLWSGGVCYTAIFTTVSDGCDITVKAPGGFTSINHWRLLNPPHQDAKRCIQITSDAKCNRTFAAFVKKFLENSHAALHRAFKEHAEKAASLSSSLSSSSSSSSLLSSRPGFPRRRSSWPNTAEHVHL